MSSAQLVPAFVNILLYHQLPAYWDNAKEEAQKCDSVDISIAVATEKVWQDCPQNLLFLLAFSDICDDSLLIQGLMTPIIRNADQKTISAISSEV